MSSWILGTSQFIWRAWWQWSNEAASDKPIISWWDKWYIWPVEFVSGCNLRKRIQFTMRRPHQFPLIDSIMATDVVKRAAGQDRIEEAIVRRVRRLTNRYSRTLWGEPQGRTRPLRAASFVPQESHCGPAVFLSSLHAATLDMHIQHQCWCTVPAAARPISDDINTGGCKNVRLHAFVYKAISCLAPWTIN